MNSPKSILQSRIFWVNALSVSVATAGFLAGQSVIVQYPKAVACLIVAQGILNIALRLVTTKPIK